VKLSNLGLFLAAFALTLPAQNISTIAGGGATGAGDGNAATLAFLNKPTGLAITQTTLAWMTPPLPKGSLLIVDQSDQRIRAVTPQGVMTTVAGTGNAGYMDGPAATAQFNFPFYVRTDEGGNIYLTEFIGKRVRKIDTTGNVTTIAGTGMDGDGPDNVAATARSFHALSGIALDPATGNIYVADPTANRVLIITPGGIISTFAGSGAPGYSGDGGGVHNATLNTPVGLTFDSASGNLYIADQGNNRIRRVAPSGIISTFMGCTSGANCQTSQAGVNGPATSTFLFAPQAISIGPDGIYVADAITQLTASILWKVDVNGNATVVGETSGETAELIALAVNNIFYSEVQVSRTVQMFTGAGPKTYAGGGLLEGSPATSVGIIGPPAPTAVRIVPAGIKTDTAGNVYFSDYGENVVRKIDANGIVHTVAGNGVLAAGGDGGLAVQSSLAGPLGLDFDAQGNLYIAEVFAARVRKVSPTGTITTFAGTGSAGFSGDGGAATSAQLSAPTSVVVDPAGNNIYIVDSGNNRIRKVNAAGMISTYAGNTISSGSQLCNGASSFSCGDGGPATAALLSDPVDAVLDSSGQMYIVERFIQVGTGAAGGFRVRKIDTTGKISTIAGNGNNDTSGEGGGALQASIGNPAGIAMDKNSGNLYVSDDRNQRILRIDSNVTKICGAIVGGTPNTGGYSGDGGPALQAAINRPQGLTFDAGGNLMFWDAGNNRLRKIANLTASSGQTLVAVSGNQQTGVVNNVLLTPIAVRVLNGVTPQPNVNVNFTVTPATSATLSAATVVTDSTGTASVTVTLGVSASNFTVTAAVSGLTPVVFTETTTSQLNAAVEGAGFTVGAALAPGGISSLFGAGLASSTEQAAVIPLPTTLATNTSMNVVTSTATLSAPLFYVSPTQINFQMPFEIGNATSVSLVLTTGGVSSSPLVVGVAPTAPGIFASTTGVAAALHGLTNTSITPASPAKPGEIIVVYCAGLGAVSPSVLSGTAAPPAGPNSTANANVTASIGGTSAAVQFAGLAPGYVGLYQVNMVIPTTVAASATVPIVVTANNLTSKMATIPVAAQ